MARLPQPGGDSGNWGDILNDYLSQAHKADGTLKDDVVTSSTLAPNSVTSVSIASNAVTATQIADGSISETQLSTGVVTKLNTPATINDGSINKTKLETNVQTSLDKADSALQSADITGKADDASVLHKSGTETVIGSKDFTGGVTINGTNIVVTSDTRLGDDRTPKDSSVTNGKLLLSGGADGQVLTKDAAQSGGFKWADTGGLSQSQADSLYAPRGIFTYTYIPQGTSADFSNLQNIINTWSASGLPGVIRIGSGTMTLQGSGSQGAIRLPANAKQLLIEGAGIASTKFVLTRSVPRLFDLYGTGAGNTFANITVRNFSVDGGNISNTSIAPAVTVTSDTSLSPGSYTSVPISNNSGFSGAGTRWAAVTAGTGTAVASRMLFTLPGSGTTSINLYNSTGNATTLKSGDTITGYLYDHVIIGNNNVGSTSGTGQILSNIVIEDIEATNIATQYVNGLGTFTPSTRFGIYLTPGVGGSATNITIRRVNITGSECGFNVPGVANSWLDNIVIEDCSHDTGIVPTMNSGSLNYLIGAKGYLGRCRVERCTGTNSADVGVEIDQAMHSTVTDCLMVNSYSAGYYVTNFVPPARSAAGPLTTTLSAGIGSGDTSIAVNTLPSNWPKRGYAQIGSETIYYVASSATSLTVMRGMDTSTAASAVSGTTVTLADAGSQIGTYTRCRSTNTSTPGKGWWFNPNSAIPMQGVRIRDSSFRTNVTDLTDSMAVLTTGCVSNVDIDGLTCEVQLANTTAQPTATYAALRLYRPGETARNSSIGRPTDVRIRKTGIIVNGSVASTNSKMYPIWLAEGFYSLDIESEVRNYSTGFTNGGTSGIFIGGSTMSQVQNGTIALKYISITTSDSLPHIIYMNGSVGISQWLHLSVDMSESFTTTNQIPWDIPSTLRPNIIIDQVTPPRLSTAYNSLKPERIVSVTTSPYNANHADRIILVGMSSATATINLPTTNSGHVLAVPRPGSGTRMTIKDVSGAASTYAITINAASGETIDGSASKTISANYGVLNLVSTGTGWAVI